MSIHRKQPHLACYDIADPRRLQRVHRYLKGIGIPLQYSVFLLYLNRDGLVQVVQKLERLIDPREDDVRLYPLPQKPDWLWWGRPVMPEGVHWFGIGLPEPVHVLNFVQTVDEPKITQSYLDITI